MSRPGSRGAPQSRGASRNEHALAAGQKKQVGTVNQSTMVVGSALVGDTPKAGILKAPTIGFGDAAEVNEIARAADLSSDDSDELDRRRRDAPSTLDMIH